jgi:hypothetical protein
MASCDIFLATVGRMTWMAEQHNNTTPTNRPTFTHRWNTRRVHPDKYAQLCRIIPRVLRNGSLGVYSWGEKVTVEFEDGTTIDTTRNYLRSVRSLHNAPTRRIGAK